MRQEGPPRLQAEEAFTDDQAIPQNKPVDVWGHPHMTLSIPSGLSFHQALQGVFCMRGKGAYALAR